MSYRYNLSQEAEDDIFEGYIWYEQKKTGLGDEFLKGLDKARQSILKNPTTYPTRDNKKIRAFLVKRFPYLILYTVEKNDINVISVFNTNQDPDSWKKRIE